MDEPATPSAAIPARILDMESLKALAHPLRVAIVDTLSTYGPFTASGLAERLGESSGATSYHLRQLEKHGFVREVAGRGTGRERWWERMPGTLNLNSTELPDTPANRAVTKTVLREWERSRAALLSDFNDRGYELLSKEWIASTDMATLNLRLTQEQLKEIVDGWMEFIEPYIEKYRGQNPVGSRPVQIQFNAFPVVDGEETTDSVGGDQ